MRNEGKIKMKASRRFYGVAVCAFAAVFAAAMAQAGDRTDAERFLREAERLKPKLFSRAVSPVRLVRAVADRRAYQGWCVEPAGDVPSVLNRRLKLGDEFVLDFGEHLVGYLSVDVAAGLTHADSPVRLHLVYAEMPAELALPFGSAPKTLSRSWLPEELVFIDDVPANRELPRRHAFRYVKVRVDTTCDFAFAGFSARAVTSADESRLTPWKTDDAELAKIDATALRTLRDCMQTTLEDGPKRDTRLWIGDLRLQALANYVSYRNYDIVRRCLYHFAGTVGADGLVASDAYERPRLAPGVCRILDYTALFPVIVLEYLEATGDVKTAEELWPCCRKQVEHVLATVGDDGLFADNGKWWCFIDWNEALDRQAAEQGVIVYALRRVIRLAGRLGRAQEAEDLVRRVETMERAARTRLWDAKKGVFVSGKRRQVSQMAQAWLVLADVAVGEQARQCLRNALKDGTSERPKTPYACYYLTEALQHAGLDGEADRLLRTYWGGMIARGADTFWEAFDPSDDFASPYGSVLYNSACHAWSCGPTYLLRRQSQNKGAAAFQGVQ